MEALKIAILRVRRTDFFFMKDLNYLFYWPYYDFYRMITYPVYQSLKSYVGNYLKGDKKNESSNDNYY